MKEFWIACGKCYSMMVEVKVYSEFKYNAMLIMKCLVCGNEEKENTEIGK